MATPAQAWEMPPDPEKNKAYYADNLEHAMLEETRRFFNHLLSENRNLLEFIDSDYTFLNSALARHYGIPKVTANASKRSPFCPNTTAAACSDTEAFSPPPTVWKPNPWFEVFGFWKTLLGTPPNPPPPDADPIEPDTRGVSTMRQLMEKHRENPTCFECHRKMIPWAFPWKSTIRMQEPGVTAMPSVCPLTGEAKCPTARPSTVHDIKEYLPQGYEPNQFYPLPDRKALHLRPRAEAPLPARDGVDRIVSVMPSSITACGN